VDLRCSSRAQKLCSSSTSSADSRFLWSTLLPSFNQRVRILHSGPIDSSKNSQSLRPGHSPGCRGAAGGDRAPAASSARSAFLALTEDRDQGVRETPAEVLKKLKIDKRSRYFSLAQIKFGQKFNAIRQGAFYYNAARRPEFLTKIAHPTGASLTAPRVLLALSTLGKRPRRDQHRDDLPNH
jgi:hypothetical protein